MKLFLLYTLLIGQCVFASDDENPLTLTTPINQKELIIEKLHARTTFCEAMLPGLPLYNRELTNQLFEQGDVWDSPPQECSDRCLQCYVGARRAGCGFEHCAYAVGCAVCSATLPITVMTTVSGTVSKAAISWLANVVLGAICVKSAQWASEDTKKKDVVWSNPESWGHRPVALAPMSEDSSSSEEDEELSK